MHRLPAVCLTVSLACAATTAHAQPSSQAAFELTLVSLTGNKQVIATLPTTIFAPRVSPDGAEVAFEVADFASNSARITIAERDDFGNRRELPPYDGAMNWAPAWTLDGERIVFLASTPAGDRIWWQQADGSGDGAHLVDGRSAESWVSPRALTYLTLTGDGDYGIRMLDLEAGESEALVDLPGSAEHSSNVSRDGRYLAYVSNASGRFEVFVEPLPQTGERVQITTEGGGHPVWSRDGRTLYFDRDGRMFRIAFDSGRGRASGAPEALPIEGFVQGAYRRQFDLMPDGERFLMLFLVANE